MTDQVEIADQPERFRGSGESLVEIFGFVSTGGIAGASDCAGNYFYCAWVSEAGAFAGWQVTQGLIRRTALAEGVTWDQREADQALAEPRWD